MDKQYNPDGFIPKHGGYERLITYQKAEVIFDGTHYFCKKYFHPYDRTVDQMVQAPVAPDIKPQKNDITVGA